MQKKLSAKIIALVAALAVLASAMVPLSGIFVSAASPAIPENAVAVLDEAGVIKQLGGKAEWPFRYVGDWHYKDNAGDADFSTATSIELDFEIGDYDAFKEKVESNNLRMWFRLASGTSRYFNSTAANITFDNFEHLYDNWYHVSIPTSKFTRNESGSTDWTSIKHWQFFIESSVTLDDLYSIDFNIINICAVSTRPSMPDNVVAVIDEKGRNNTLGNSATSGQFAWLQDRVNGVLSAAVDVSEADFIEFDVQINKYDELVASMTKNNVILGFNLTSSAGSFYESRDAVKDILQYAEPLEDDWYHFTIPVDSFTSYNQMDWTNVWRWMFFFEGSGSRNLLGSIYDCSFYAINICGTEYVPDVPDNSVMVIDKDGNDGALGDSFAFSVGDTVEAKDVTSATRIDLDIRFTDFDALEAAMAANSLSLELELVSSEGTAVAGGIESLAQASYNGWYHVSVMKSLFTASNGFAWSDITGWSIKLAGDTSVASGELAGSTAEVLNVCGAIAPRPELPLYSGIALDEEGIKGTLAEKAETKWGVLADYHKKTELFAVDYSGAYYIDFDIEIGDIVALKALIEDNGVTAAFELASDSAFENSAKAEISFADLSHVDDNWYHVSLPVSDFTSNGIDWSAVTAWRLSFETENSEKAVGEDYSMKFNIGNVCNIDRPSLPENAVVVLDEEGGVSKSTLLYSASWPWRYLNDYHSRSGLEAKDITSAEYIEFDIKIGDYTTLANTLNEKGMSFTFRVTSSNTLWQNSVQCAGIFNYMQHTYGDWYHFRIPAEKFSNSGHGEMDWTAVNTWVCYSGGSSNDLIGDLYSMDFLIVNVCGTVYGENAPLDKPALPSDAVYVMDQHGVKGTLGTQLYSKYSDISDTFTSTHFLRGEANLAKYIAFNLYVENKGYIPSDLSVAFKLESGKYIESVAIAEQITESGWNEIVIPVTKLKVSDAEELGRLAGWKLVSEDGATVGGSYSTVIWACNFIGIVVADAPDMPENAIVVMNYRGLTTTLGAAYSYLQDRLYQQNIGPFDISDGDYIELDLFVSDYESLVKAFEENPDSIGSFVFCVSSGDPEKYGNPRYFNRVQYNIIKQITANGWNHIKIPIHKMTETGEGAIDLENVRNFMFAITGSNNQLATGDNANIIFKAINVCVTRVRPLVEIEPDEVQAFRPDDNAVYINDAEDVFDENGTWNPVAVAVESDYKTEGTSSVYNTFLDQTLRSNQLRYLFNKTADVSDMKTLKFDLFIRDIDLLRQRATMSVVLSNDARGTKNYQSWKLDLSKLKDGWNSIEIDISKGYTSNGTLDLAELKSFIVQCDTATFQSGDYVEKVVVGIDNIRYISKTGNTKLKINSDEEESFENTDFGGDYDFDYEVEELPDLNVELSGGSKGGTDTQIIKKNITQTILEYSWLIIALAAEAVAVAAILTVLLLIKRKKNKAQQ